MHTTIANPFHARPFSTDAPELVKAARELIPLLRERAAADEARRKVDPDTVARMKDAGLFRALQARRWGGREAGQGTFAQVQMALAEGDMSVAWMYGIVSVHSFHLCLMDDRAARDVWGAAPVLFSAISTRSSVTRVVLNEAPPLGLSTTA